MSLARKKLEVSLANVVAARLNNELRVEEMREAIERIEKDIEISKAKEAEIQEQLSKNEG